MATIRPAREADVPAILALHNHHILNSLAIWRHEPASLDERLGWFRERTQRGFPVLIAEVARPRALRNLRASPPTALSAPARATTSLSRTPSTSATPSSIAASRPH